MCFNSKYPLLRVKILLPFIQIKYNYIITNSLGLRIVFYIKQLKDSRVSCLEVKE